MPGAYLVKLDGTTKSSFKIGKMTLNFGSLTQQRSLIFPDSNGSSGQFLRTDGAGNLTWVTPTASAAWGSITGTLSSQTDLQSALDTKQPIDGDLTAIAALAGTSGLARKTAANTWALDTNAYLTGNQTITFTGDASGSGATSVALTLGAGVVSNAKLASAAANTVKANATNASASPADLAMAASTMLARLAAGDIVAATPAQVRALLGVSQEVFNGSSAAQGPGFAADTYLIGSSCAIPNGSLKAQSRYYCVFNVVKTAAGTATPIINVRIGTVGSTADASRGTLTFTAGTAVIDEGVVEVWVTFRSVGSGTTAVVQTLARFTHRLSVTGLVGANAESEPEIATSSGFDSTVANSTIGISVNGGASAAWTVTLVQSELLNLL